MRGHNIHHVRHFFREVVDPVTRDYTYICKECGAAFIWNEHGDDLVDVLVRHLRESDCFSLSKYRLYKWAHLIRERDDRTCFLCGNAFGIREVQAHHIYPKSIYPEMAYFLENGVLLCTEHHQHVVHSHPDQWERFTQLFWRYSHRAANTRYNNIQQRRV